MVALWGFNADANVHHFFLSNVKKTLPRLHWLWSCLILFTLYMQFRRKLDCQVSNTEREDFAELWGSGATMERLSVCSLIFITRWGTTRLTTSITMSHPCTTESTYLDPRLLDSTRSTLGLYLPEILHHSVIVGFTPTFWQGKHIHQGTCRDELEATIVLSFRFTVAANRPTRF